MRTAWLCLLALALAAQTGCGSARRGEPFSGPFEPPTEQVALGRKVFMENCHQCHPGGEKGVGPSLNEKPLPGFLMKFQVRHGLGAMPAIPLESNELDALIAYLKTLRHHH
ncbi:MAG: c-type cytochrome [Acidobacteriota bacterium]